MDQNDKTPTPLDPETEQIIDEMHHQEQSSSQQDVVSGGKKSNKKLITILLVVLLVALGVGAWLYGQKSNEASQATNSSNTGGNTNSPSAGPAAVAYAYSDVANKSTLYWRPASGGDRVKALDLPDNMFISHSVVHGMQVAVVAEAGSESNQALSIWYSSDGGKKYTKIFTDSQANVNTNGGLSSQITSLVFATDGKSLVYGYAPMDSTKDTQVTQLTLSGDYATKVLFSSKLRGVFLQGYDSASQQAIYFEGCYNCDGNTASELLLRDGKTNQVKTLQKSETYTKVAVKQDFSEILLLNGTYDASTDNLLGGGSKAPYTLKKMLLADSSTSVIATIAEEPWGIGYTADKELPYYNAGMKVVRIDGTTPTTVYEAQKDILNAYYVGQNQVLASDGTYENFVLNNFTIKSQSNTSVLEGDSKTRIFGVTYQ